MNCKGLYIGSIATALYIISVVIGGFVIDNYNHLNNSLREITYLGSETFWLVTVLYFLFNVGLLMIATGPSRSVHGKIIKVTLWTFGAIGLLGIAIFFLSPNTLGTEYTTTETFHIVLAELILLLTTSSAITAGFSLGQVDRKKEALLSWVTAGIILTTGILGIVGWQLEWKYIGLWERLSMGTFLIWMVWFTLKLKKIVKEDYI